MSRQHNPPHPGEFIRQVYLEPAKGKLSRSEVARHLEVSRSTFNRLVNEKSDLSSEMALRLSAVLGGSPESWLGLQQSYDLWKANKTLDLSSINPIDQSFYVKA